jgi:L-galactose dehydrogenase/L-glyceraldehyde 3-phosphate reductase
MEQRSFGRTGLSVSALGFGCGAVGGLMVKGDAGSQARAVQRAWDAGVRYFDTARSYGDGVSESNLGRALQELRLDPVVGTKFRVESGDTDVAGAIRDSLRGSLERLRRDSVHLFQLHNQIVERPRDGALTVDQVLGPVADALDRLREEGLIGHAGITGMGETAAVRRVVESGRIASAQIYFNAVNPSAGFAGKVDAPDQDYDGLIDRAAASGVGVINIRPLAAGALSATDERHPNAGSRGGSMAGSNYERDLARAQAIADLAGELGLEGPVEFAVRFTLSKPGISTVLVGLSSEEQLEDALRWAERGPLPAEAVGRLLSLRGR